MILLGIVVLNAGLGLMTFTTAWNLAKKHIVRDESRDKHHMAWRRDDAPNWSYWRMLPFALTILFPRILFWFITLFI